MSSLQRALLAAPSLPAFSLPRNAHSSQRGAPESSKEFESLPRWRPKAKRRRFAIDRLGDFASASSSTSSASASSSSSFSSSSASSLAAAASAALARSLYPELINDPFASLLAEAAGLEKKTTDGEEGEEAKGAEPSPSTPPRAAFAAAAAAFADATLLRASDLVNLEADRDGLEYRQVVLLGPGLDSRAQRLAWPLAPLRPQRSARHPALLQKHAPLCQQKPIAPRLCRPVTSTTRPKPIACPWKSGSSAAPPVVYSYLCHALCPASTRKLQDRGAVAWRRVFAMRRDTVGRRGRTRCT